MAASSTNFMAEAQRVAIRNVRRDSNRQADRLGHDPLAARRSPSRVAPKRHGTYLSQPCRLAFCKSAQFVRIIHPEFFQRREDFLERSQEIGEQAGEIQVLGQLGALIL